MTVKNTAYRHMLRERKPQRGAAHALMEDLADGLFRGPAKTNHGIDLAVLTASAQQLSQEKMLKQLPDSAVPHLISRLGGDDPATGILVFDGVTTDALIEQQTLGRVSAAPRVERAVTAIDAALSSAFATSVIAKLESLTDGISVANALQGYSCGRPQIDRAALSLALSSKFYDVLNVEIDLGPGLKRGGAQLIVPASLSSGTPEAKTPSLNAEMVETVQDAVLQLHVRLPSIRLPLRTLVSLKPDGVLELLPEALTQAQVVDPKGRKVANAKLGQFKGKRAVRVEIEVPVVKKLEPQGLSMAELPSVSPALSSAVAAQDDVGMHMVLPDASEPPNTEIEGALVQ